MYSLGGYPGFKRVDTQKEKLAIPTVFVEVYRVTPGTLKALDNLEGHGYGFYERIPIKGHDVRTGKLVDFEIYEYCRQVFENSEILNGDWLEYLSNRSKAI
jgi:gamma-glutamylcyclotransferase (GGCT)/AIG2-like uncharacterized protein YtfP